MQSALNSVIECTADAGIPVLLVGGQALQAYGVIRQTMDIDIVIADDDALKAREALGRRGFSVIASTELFTRYRNQNRSLPDVDVLMVDTLTFAKLMRDAGKCQIGGSQVTVPSPAHFVSLKLHAMRNDRRREARDLADIVEIARTRNDALPAMDLRKLCEQYGPQGIWERVEAAL